jgi:FkbM family methyltransferase
MFPKRLQNLRPYLASFIHSRFDRPSVSEMLHWIFQPGKESRAEKFVGKKNQGRDFTELHFKGNDNTFYYPAAASWIDLCQTIDECFNPKNWHHFITTDTPITADDVVVDCGAAEGLFSFVAANTAKKVYAIEPIPSWHESLEKTFHQSENVEILKVGVSHHPAVMRMTDDEIYSRISNTGSLEIQVTTLDSIFADKNIPVSFIKADIEGFEFQMLLGAEETIRRNRPKISLTVYHDTNHFEEIREFLQNIHDDYQFKTIGIAANGNPILIQAF